MLLSTSAQAQRWSGNTSPSYPTLISYLDSLDRKHTDITLYSMGASDYGLPIYLCVINGLRDSTKTFEKARNGSCILINNAIHAGEPDGINATLIWLEQWILAGKPKVDSQGNPLPLIAFIPAYNVGGMMNRSSTSRANQNGPESYGFRGNAQNLDLNRDFIKMDAQNTFTFARIYQALDPDVFIDNHVSNGADYQYTLTFISSLKERLAPSMQQLTYTSCIPTLQAYCQTNSVELFPYVDLKGETPESGIVAFNDLPRYAMGYASLFHSLSFTVETHMLKPFPERVQATLVFLNTLISYSMSHAAEIETARTAAKNWAQQQGYFYFNYQLDETQKDRIRFKGYEANHPVHPITGLPQLEYDRSKPYERDIPYFHSYQARDSVKIPTYYIVAAQERDVIARLEANGVEFRRIEKDSSVSVSIRTITHFAAPNSPYEGHFKLTEIESELHLRTVLLKPGDLLIPTKQERATFIHTVLQAHTEDSYLSWNFFDSYLQQKEFFSGYVFIEHVEAILENNSELKAAYEHRKQLDAKFAASEWEQLLYIYQHSPYFEPSYMVLPIYELAN
ncbi:MAG: hypothetical protein RLZZ301_1850 [Bacteroidota bacterium]